jgi:hypothetical protein
MRLDFPRFNKFLFALVLLTVLFPQTISYAQPGDPSTNPDVVPIHGIAYLLLGGLILGIKKVIGNRKQKS